MILITGAGGKTGKSLIKVLSEVEDICALVRREEQAVAVQELGAQNVIIGDMSDRSVAHSAVRGARAIYHICPNMSPDELEIGKLIIEAAHEIGVQHFVYHSVLHPQIEKMNHHWQKLRVEERIFESGLPFTILQPTPYMQNLLANWRSIIEEGLLRVPYSVHSTFSFVDLEDVAEAAKIVLTEPNHINAIYELAGTGPTSHLQVAEIFGRVLKRYIRAEKEEIRDWKTRAERSERFLREQSKRDEYAVANLINMFDYYDQWGLAGNPNVLKWVLKREPTSFQTFIQRTLAEHPRLH